MSPEKPTPQHDDEARVRRYRSRSHVEALQWLGNDHGDHMATMAEFTDSQVESSAGVATIRTLFMALPSDDADDILGEADSLELQQAGYTAVVYNDGEGEWLNVATGDWVIKGHRGALFPWRADRFADTYELADDTELGVTKGLPGLVEGLKRTLPDLGGSLMGEVLSERIKPSALDQMAPGATRAAQTGFDLVKRHVAFVGQNVDIPLAAALDVIGRRTDIVAIQLPEPDEGVWYINEHGGNVHPGPVGQLLVDNGAILWGINTDEARTLAAALLAAAARADAAEGEAK